MVIWLWFLSVTSGFFFFFLQFTTNQNCMVAFLVMFFCYFLCTFVWTCQPNCALVEGVGCVECDAFDILHELKHFVNGDDYYISLYFWQFQAPFPVGLSMWLSHRHLRLALSRMGVVITLPIAIPTSPPVSPISVNGFPIYLVAQTRNLGFMHVSSLSLLLPRHQSYIKSCWLHLLYLSPSVLPSSPIANT